MQNGGTLSRVCFDVFDMVISYCGKGYNGILRLVCKEWQERIHRAPLRYAIITTDDLFHWTSKIPGFNHHQCALVMAYYGRHELMHLVPSSGPLDAVLVVHSYLIGTKTCVCDMNLYKELWKRWNWGISLVEAVYTMGRCLMSGDAGLCKKIWKGLTLGVRLKKLDVRYRVYGRWHACSLNGHCLKRKFTTDDELCRGIMYPEQLSGCEMGASMPATTITVHLQTINVDFFLLALNVHTLTDVRVLDALEKRENTRQVSRFARALAHGQYFSVPDARQLGNSVVVWLSLALYHGNVAHIKKYKHVLQDEDRCFSCEYAIEHLIVTSRLHVLREAEIDTTSQLMQRMFERLHQQFVIYKEPKYAHYICAEIGVEIESDDRCESYTGDDFFMNKALDNDGKAAEWMAKHGCILPFDIARVVLRNPDMHERALEFGFAFPDTTIVPVC